MADGSVKYDMPVSSKELEKIFAGCYDFEKRKLTVGGRGGVSVTLCFIDGLVSSEAVAREIIRPLTSDERFAGARNEPEIISLAMGGVVYGQTARRRDVLDDVINDLLNGFCAVIFEKEKSGVTFETRTG